LLASAFCFCFFEYLSSLFLSFTLSLPPSASSFQFDILFFSQRNTTDKPFKCRFPDCGKSFTAKSSLQVHWRAHGGNFLGIEVWQGET